MRDHQLVGSDGEHAVLHELGGDGPPLLLTHGNGLNAGMWSTAAPHLSRQFSVFALDFRGHGASRPIADGFSVARATFMGEVLAAVALMGGAPVRAAGHSLGGATLINTELSNPGTFSKLWVFEPVIVPEGFARPDGEHPLVVASRKRRMHFDSADAAYERFVSKPPYSDCEPDAVRAYVELRTYSDGDGVRLSCSGDTEARVFSTGEPTNFEELSNVTCPTIVARGNAVAKGNEMPPQIAPAIAEALGTAELVGFDGLTHFGPMEDGATIADAIIRHLA
jgi:pimeloyl-ACP methyl ester carboxylesterase